MKYLFMLSISFKSYLIRHSGTGRAFKNTQRALEQLRHSESTQKALRNLEGTQALQGHLGTRALKAVGRSDT